MGRNLWATNGEGLASKVKAEPQLGERGPDPKVSPSCLPP